MGVPIYVRSTFRLVILDPLPFRVSRPFPACSLLSVPSTHPKDRCLSAIFRHAPPRDASPCDIVLMRISLAFLSR
ncbi:hypothetical protein IAS59_002803 [Cryptococcus gattii]